MFLAVVLFPKEFAPFAKVTKLFCPDVVEKVLSGRLPPTITSILGALVGGSAMSSVDFKKWQCPLSLL